MCYCNNLSATEQVIVLGKDKQCSTMTTTNGFEFFSYEISGTNINALNKTSPSSVAVMIISFGSGATIFVPAYCDNAPLIVSRQIVVSRPQCCSKPLLLFRPLSVVPRVHRNGAQIITKPHFSLNSIKFSIEQ